MKTIKKYKNRRLYDSDLSRYITFDEIRQYVLDDVDFKVIDSTSDKDITAATLLQVIVEQESNVNNCFSNQALRYLIKMSSHPMSSGVSELFEQTMAVMTKQMDNNPMMDNYQKSMEQWQQNMQTAMKNWQDMFK